MADARTPTVIVAICTFRRAALVQTLASLALLNDCGMAVEVAVADNDTTPSARDTVERAALDHPLPLAYLHAPARNISVARNALLDHARARGARLLVFVDDDETVRPEWLAEFVRAWADQGCGAMLGPVRAGYPDHTPEWMIRARVHDTLPVTGRDGRIRTGYGGNTLLDLSDPAWSEVRFDPARGRSGGEDTAIFADYVAAGGRIGYAPKAVVDEPVLPDRVTLHWLLNRRYRMGQSHASIVARGVGPAGRVGAAGMAAAKAVACGGMALLSATDPARRNSQLMRAALHAGAVAHLAGALPPEIYGTTPGLPRDPKGI